MVSFGQMGVSYVHKISSGFLAFYKIINIKELMPWIMSNIQKKDSPTENTIFW